MAYVPSFENDVFLSYAIVDDVPLPGVQEGWITGLRRCLESELARKLGRTDAFKLWHDTAELAGNKSLTQQLIAATSRSAVMVLVLSPGYLASEWCQRERSNFLEVLRGRSDSSIFVVELDAVQVEDKPKELRDLRGYKFWKLNERNETRALGFPTPDQEFYSAALSLSNAIANELKQQRKTQQQGPTVSSHPPLPPGRRTSSEQVVFLAQTTDDLDGKRNGVKSYLAQFGFTVVPAHDYSADPESFDEASRADLARSTLFVQLLSDVPGKRPPALPQGYSRLQFELAQDAGLPIMQWRSQDLVLSEVEDAEHQSFLSGDLVRAEGIEDFKREVKRRLEYKSPTESQRSNAFVFINVEASDRRLGEELCKIVQRCGADYVLPTSGPDPAANRKGLRTYLTSCDAMIVVYGETAPSWVKSQLLEWRKWKAQRRKPLRGLAVLHGPPPEKTDLGIYISPMVVLDARTQLDGTTIERFLRNTSS